MQSPVTTEPWDPLQAGCTQALPCGALLTRCDRPLCQQAHLEQANAEYEAAQSPDQWQYAASTQQAESVSEQTLGTACDELLERFDAAIQGVSLPCSIALPTHTRVVLTRHSCDCERRR